ncbi:hypothetical protein RND81_14G099700 [Saponaria officinalis]|uniref:Uncharacterized protein n=1 Tax=Saponaria officinalis TaxID=3572 RepID=A0AAW1GNF6_SAPOF
MISNPNLVHYTCIAHNTNIDSGDSTILAEFNSGDSSLNELAQQCLHHTPPHHTNFSQTFKNQTFTFLLDYPFVYFGIFDPNFMKFDQFNLLGKLRDTLNRTIKGNPNQKFTSFCLQGEIHPIFHKLLSKSLDFDTNNSNNDHNNVSFSTVSGSSKGRKMMGLGMLNCCKNSKGVKKKRMSMSSESVSNNSKEALMEGKVNVSDNNVDVGEVKSREIVCENGVCLLNPHGNGHNNRNNSNNINSNGNGYVRRQKAKKKWKQIVWIVLVLDLAICLILFGIWLFVCQGFQCIEG